MDAVPASSMPVFAHERSLPIHPTLAPLLAGPDGTSTPSAGLVRGQTVVCAGSAGVSCALGLVAGVTGAGSWAAIVGLPSIGVQAAAAIGVSLDRTVFVRQPGQDRVADTARKDPRSDIGSALSALIDGIDLVVVSRRVLAALSSSFVRRLQSRAQSKGSVLLVIGEPASTSVDIRLAAHTVHWEGVGEGYGHLRRRLVAVEMDGRRCPRPRRHTVWLPDERGALASVDRLAAIGEGDPHLVSGPPERGEDGIVIPLRRHG